MPSPALLALLESVAAGRVSPERAAAQADAWAVAQLGDITLDLGRAIRCRFGEVIFGEGKSPELIIRAAERLLTHDQQILVTRVAAETVDQLTSHFAHHRWHPQARTLRLYHQPIRPLPPVPPPTGPSPPGERPAQPGPEVHSAPPNLPNRQPTRIHVAVVTAGSTDHPVAAEAIETLDWMGVAVDTIEDIGVAGPQRLLAVVPRLRNASAVVVVAGMEGALPSAVGGHVSCPVIAVPTSVGYGTNFAGLTPLLGMLTSCAANVTVVGIDAGFKGGYVAGLIATQLVDLARQWDAPNPRPLD